MNNITIKILLIAIVANCSVHAQQVKWVKRVGGSGDDRNLAIGVDKARNVYLGNTNMTATSTNYNGSCTITGGSSNWDAIYYTADTSGLCVNSKMFAKTASEIRSIAVDDSQYVYLTGYFSGSKTFCSSLTATVYDVFVVKQTKSGTCQWSAKGGGSGSDYAWDVKVDEDGNVYVTGQFQGTATFGSYTLVSQGGSDGFVVKYNRTGTVQWAKRFGGKKEDFGYGVSNIENGFLYITGTFDSIANFGTDTMNAMGVAKVFLAKVDVDGNFYWVKGGGSNIYSPISSRVIQDKANNVFLPMVCDSGGTFGSFVSPSTCNVLIRCNASGDVIWGTALGKQTNEYAQPEVQIFDSAIYYLGTYTAASTIGNETITPMGGADIFLTKIDYNGKPLWVESFGSTSADHGLGLAIDTFGAAYITGDFRGTATFGDSSITASGNMDAFVAKIITTLPITAVGGGNNTVCNGNSFDVTFKANRTYSSGNVFTVQLSDSTGSFSTHTNIGTDTATTGSTINCTVPGYVTSGLNYRLRVVSTNPAETGEEYRSSIRIATDTPAVPSLVTTGTFKLCGGKSIRLNATSANSIITWFTHPTGGVAVGESESGADFLFVPDTTATYYAEARNGCVQTTRTASATVKVFDIPGIPANPTSNSPQCVNTGVTLTRSGSPATGVSWFWQNTGGGTDTGYSASTRVVSVTGTYYLRARNDSALCFSTGSGSVAITANANPSSPTSVTPSSGTGVCAGGSATLRGVMSGSVIDWYKVPTGGTLVGTSSSNANFVTAPDTSTYYYAEARIAATGCVSTSRAATAYITVNPLPTTPDNPTSNSPQCSSPGVTLTRSGSPPGGISWFWQTSPTGVVTSSSGATYTATASGTYYIRARNSTTACWGIGAGSLSVTTIASPANPSNPTSNSPQCANVGVTLTRSSTPPASVSWFWQTSSTGTATTYGDSTYLATTGGTKYLRARNDTSLCWSAGNGVLAVTVNALPAAPTSVTPSSGVTVCEGSAVTVKATSAGNTIDWYFQSTGGTPVGSSASNTNYTVYPDTTGRYYAEARTAAGCASASRSQTAVVTANPNPAAPSAPAVQSVCSDSTHVFTFSSITAGSGGNQIEWARNSGFTGSTVVSSPATIYDTVPSGVNDTIWIRSRASGTGCVSGGVFTSASVNYPVLKEIFASDTIICRGFSTSIGLLHPQQSTRYDLYKDTAFLGSLSGSDTIVILSTGSLDSTSLFNIMAFDSITGCSRPFPSSIEVRVLPPMDTLVFVVGDTVLCMGGYSCYSAIVSSSPAITYYSVTGGAEIDSLNGCVYNVTGDFTISATAISVLSCDTLMTDINVSVPHYISPPIAPPSQIICSDTAYNFVFNDISSLGCEVDVIDFSLDSIFATYDTFPNHSGFEINVPIDSSFTIWFRCRNRSLGLASSLVNTTVEVHSGILNSNLIEYDTVVCFNDSQLIYIASSHHWLLYKLVSDTTLIYEAFGNDTILELSTGAITSPIQYNVVVLDTSTQCIHELPLMHINVAFPSDSPVFVSGSTTLCIGDISCYNAFVDSNTSITYSIASGGANIDSITGCVSNVASDFVVRASVLDHCGAVFKDLEVIVHSQSTPYIPTATFVCNGNSKYLHLDSVYTRDCGTNKIEYSFDSTFATSSFVYSPALIAIELDSPNNRILWIRGIDSISNLASNAIPVAIPSYLAPYPPNAPSDVALCHDTSAQIFFDSIYTVACGGQLIEYSFDSTFALLYSMTSPANVSFWLDIGETDTLWLRSRDTISGLASDAVFAVAKLLSGPGIPQMLTVEPICSDSPVIFHITPTPGVGGNVIEWAYNNTFVGVQEVVMPYELNFEILSSQDTTIYIRSKDSISGLSGKSYLTATLKVLPLPHGYINPTDTLIDAGDSVLLSVTSDELCSYFWIGSDTFSESYHARPYMDSTYYTVILTDTFGCTNTKTSKVRQHRSTGGDGIPNATYYPLNDNSALSRSINTSKPVGTIPSIMNVSNTGGAIYTIPIAIPPGTNGMSPKLSLTYNSQSGNGMAGLGWNVMGISQISREGRNIYNNGEVAAVSFTNADAFSFDGQRLIPTSGLNAGDGTCYSTELESFSKIYSYGEYNGVSGNPEWFKVTTKEGLEMEFGRYSNSSVINSDRTSIMQWRLNRVTDNFGNYYIVNYSGLITPDGHIQNVITDILYTGGNGLSPYNQIGFSYVARADENMAYMNGSFLPDYFLIDKITIRGEGSIPFKEYQFRYGFNGTYSILNELIEAGADGSTLNSTIFKNGTTTSNMTMSSCSDVQNQAVDIITGDYNGDGFSDILAITKDYINSIPYHSKFTIYRKKPNTNCFEIAGSKNLDPQFEVINNFKIPNVQQITTSDHNGDGADDIVTVKKHKHPIGNSMLLDEIVFHQSTNDARTISPLARIEPPIVSGIVANKMNMNGHDVIVADFDGDGRSDCLTFLSPGDYYRTYLSLPSKGLINEQIYDILTGEKFISADKINVIDFDGDGKADLMVTKGFQTIIYTLMNVSGHYQLTAIAWLGYPTKWHAVYLGDFNGDHKTDILTRVQRTDNWEIGYSTGKVFLGSLLSFDHKPYINEHGYGDKLIIADYNGDNRSDILHIYDYNSTSTMDMYYSSGLHFNKVSSSYGMSLQPNQPIVAADFTGDGRTDILIKTYYGSPFDILSFRPEGTEILLEKIANGFNEMQTFEYNRLTAIGSFYRKGTGSVYPMNNVQFPAYVVSTTTTLAGDATTTSVTNYQYADARYHRTGRGFLGFGNITTSNSVLNLVKSSTFEFNNTYFASALKRVTTFLANGTSTSRLENTNAYVGLANQVFYIRTVAINEWDYVNNFYKNTVNDQFDSYGNITHNIINNNGQEQMDFYTTFGTFGTPYPYNPVSISMMKNRTGSPSYVKEVELDYFSHGGLKSKVDYAGTSCETTTSYTYDDYGNIAGETLSASGLQDRTNTYTYDSKHRFPASKTNAISQTEYYTYDPLFGKVTEYTGIDNQVTEYQYDAFGRLSKTITPHSYDIDVSYGWDVQAITRYYSLTSHPGKPDAKTWYDLLGQELRTRVEGFGSSNWITVDKTYDVKGRLYTETKPFYMGETPFTIYYNYDNFDRISSIYTPTEQHSYSYFASSGTMSTIQAVTDNTGSSPRYSSKKEDATGKITKSDDYGGSLSFFYHSNDNQSLVKIGNSVLLTSEFDACGNVTNLTDIDAGKTERVYDAFRQLVSEKDANNKTHTMEYDKLGRVTLKTGPEGELSYQYETNASGRNQIKSVTKASWAGYNGVSEQYTYDAFSRMISFTETADNTASFTTDYSYDQYDNQSGVAYSSGVAISRNYDANGYLLTIKDQSNTHLLYQVNGMTGFGHCNYYTSGNGKVSTVDYQYGKPTRFYTNGIQDLQYQYSYPRGNIAWRKDVIKNKQEFFGYDNLDRLTSRTFQSQTINFAYNANGNIASKPDAGSYGYYSTKIHAVKHISNSQSLVSLIRQDVTYTAFNQPNIISEGANRLEFSYGADYQRNKMEWKYNGNEFITRYYSGSYEVQKLKVVGVTTTNHIHYIRGIDGLVAIIERDQNGNDHYYYTYNDNLGSILTVTNQSGTVFVEQSFDAWGRKRNPTDWTYSSIPNVPAWLYRGYTGHEDITTACGLINMNGRLYDPILGRMLRPDNYVQLPYNTQSYNRYSYCINNPLKYSDPTGQMFGVDDIILGVCVGVAVGSFTGAVMASVNGKPMWQGFLLGGVIGGISGVLSPISPLAGISAIPSFVSTTVWGAAMGATSGAAFAAATGGNVKQGAMYGAIFGAVTGFISSDEMVNAFRGQGFASNDKVLANFIATGNYQGSLDYFGFEGKFLSHASQFWEDNSAEVANAVTVFWGGIYYNEGAFSNFDKLKAAAQHELFHKTRLLNGLNVKGGDTPEEWLAHMMNYKNQGLYPHHGSNIISKINSYGLQEGVYSFTINSSMPNTTSPLFQPKWWHFIYKIPRRW